MCIRDSFPGLPLTLASFLLPVSRLRREDFPTLDRPANAISLRSGAGYWDGFTATVSRSDLFIFIFLILYENFFQCIIDISKEHEFHIIPHHFRDILYIDIVFCREQHRCV